MNRTMTATGKRTYLITLRSTVYNHREVGKYYFTRNAFKSTNEKTSKIIRI